jgi:hypothetical protein
MPTRKANRKANKTRRGAGLRVLYGSIKNSTGKRFTNSNFSKGNNRGFNAYWQDINKLLGNHVRSHFTKGEIVSDGFGGDDGSGTVVVTSKKTLPPMDFTIKGKKYTMTFDRIENNNNNA